MCYLLKILIKPSLHPSFVVVCSYQSGMQTVRASFTVPGKNGVAAAYEPNDPFEPDEDQRLGRELRQMRYVNKTELVLREPESSSDSQSETESVEQAAVVEQTQPPTTEQTTQPRGQGRALNLNEVNSLAEEPAAEGHHLEPVVGTKWIRKWTRSSTIPWGKSFCHLGYGTLNGIATQKVIIFYFNAFIFTITFYDTFK